MNILNAKFVAGLALALLFSLGGNAFFIWHAGKVEGKAQNQATIDSLETQNASLNAANTANKAIAQLARTDNTELIAELRTIADRGRGFRVVYRETANKNPLPIECKPGEGRMKDVNKFLGPQK